MAGIKQHKFFLEKNVINKLSFLSKISYKPLQHFYQEICFFYNVWERYEHLAQSYYDGILNIISHEALFVYITAYNMSAIYWHKVKY